MVGVIFVECVNANYLAQLKTFIIYIDKSTPLILYLYSYSILDERKRSNTLHLQPDYYHPGLYVYNAAYHPYPGFPHLVFLHYIALHVVKLRVTDPHVFFDKYKYNPIGKGLTNNILSHFVLFFLSNNK